MFIAIVGVSAFGNAGHAQALIAALAPGEVSWVVSRRAGAETPYREAWIECEARLDRFARLIQLTEKRLLSSKMEMCDRKIAVYLESPAYPGDRLSACVKLRFSEADP